MAEKPTPVTGLCIIAIFLGAMGILGSAIGYISLALDAKPTAPDPDPKLAEANARYERRMVELTRMSRPVLKVQYAAVLITSALLGVAGIVGLQLRGLGILLVALASNLLVDGFASGYGLYIQLKTEAIMTEYFQECARLSDMPAAVATGMKVGMYLGMFFVTGWIILKTGFYVWGLIYLSRKPLRQAFSGSAPQAADVTP